MADNKYLSKTELVEFIKNLSLIYATNEKADAVKVKTQLNEKLLPALVNAFQHITWTGDDPTGQILYQCNYRRFNFYRCRSK